VVVVDKPGKRRDVGVETALRHTLLMTEGCTAVDVGRGLVLTAAHCVDELSRGDETSVGMVLFQSPDLDFAVLFDTGRLHRPKACLRAPVLGEHLYTVGYPGQVVTGKQELTVTDGVFAGPGDGEGHYRITAPIWFGNSGGGAWGEDGCLLGLTVSGVVRLPAMNFIVSAADMMDWVAGE
jgi:S1-C subfamily serine protease